MRCSYCKKAKAVRRLEWFHQITRRARVVKLRTHVAACEPCSAGVDWADTKALNPRAQEVLL